MPTTPAAMDWDLTSYFAEFDGPAMRQFKDELQRDIATAREQAAALAPLAEDNADTWEAIFLLTEGLTDRLSHLGSYLGCLTAADARNEDYAREEAAFALLAAESEKARRRTPARAQGRLRRNVCHVRPTARLGRLRPLPPPSARRRAAHHEPGKGDAVCRPRR